MGTVETFTMAPSIRATVGRYFESQLSLCIIVISIH